MRSQSSRAFTIIELLVVVSIIALLIGILLPAIGKARDQAKLTQSQGNLRNLGAAHETYGSEWNDRQFTLVVDGLSRYGGSAGEAHTEYHNALGGCAADRRSGCHPSVLLGWAKADPQGNGTGQGLWGYWTWLGVGNLQLTLPLNFTQSDGGGFGAFRMINCAQFAQYVTGKFYDSLYYPPKDQIVHAYIEPCLDNPWEYCPDLENTAWSGYVLSPAGMFAPQVLGKNEASDEYFTDPWSIAGGFRSPSVGQCKFPTLKSRMLEHHWLQNARGDCNPAFVGDYDDCQPYFFNHGWESVPVTLFYDGHIEGLGTRESSQDNLRVLAQSGGQDEGHGLWSKDTPLGGDYTDRSEGGYYMGDAYDWTSTSYHILTTDGIQGRDKLDK